MKKIVWIGSVIFSLFAGCSLDEVDVDSDGDTILDRKDDCPNDPGKIAEGVCGCNVPDDDTDGDGMADCKDVCPDNPDRFRGTCPCDSPLDEPGVCGCDASDRDNDKVLDCEDGCPDDPAKIAEGVCGCGVSDKDSDGDSVPDCIDECPENPAVDKGGVCGCDSPDTDGDGTLDCVDECDDDPNKDEEGICGCGTPDDDKDSDTVPDCKDNCPDDPNKTEPGTCGCMIADSIDDVVNERCDPNFTGDLSVYDPLPDGDMDKDGVINDDDPCPYNPDIANDEQYKSKGLDSCATYDGNRVDIYPGSFIDVQKIKNNKIQQIFIHGAIELNYKTKYKADKGKIQPFDSVTPMLWGKGSGLEHTPISLNEGITVQGVDNASLHYTDNDGERAFLSAPLFANLNNCNISDLLIDIDFYNDKTNTQNKLKAGLVNEIKGTTLKNVGIKGSVDTELNDKYSGCLVGKVDINSKLIDVYVQDAYIKAVGDYVGGIAGYVESNSDISIKDSNVSQVYTKENKRSYIGGLFGYVAKAPNITFGNVVIDKVSGNNYVGGLFGYTKDIGNIKGNSVTVDNIEAVSDNAGGLLGYDDSSANINADSMTFKQVSGRKYVGGLAGHYRGSGLILVKNISVETLSGTEEIGGMIGRSENGVLQIDSAHVDNGSITCTKSCGGVIGYFTNKQFLLSNIECNTKKISGENELGGFAGTVSFDISNLITEFKQISTHTESILLTRTTNAEDYAGGFIGVMKLGANNDTDFVRFSNIISSVDLLDSKHFTAGFLGHVYRGGDKKYRQIMMNDILSIVYNFNDPASVESNPAGLFSVVQKHIHINAKNVVSIAVLPESARIHALFALFDGEERFAPENVYWYQFGGYSDNTKLTAEAVTEVNNITNENVDQIVDKLNASGNSKWEVKTDAEFSGQKYNIPWLSL